MNHLRTVIAPSTARSKIRRIRAKRVVSKTEREATGLLHELYAVFQNDHGQVLDEVKAASAENRERVLRVSPGVARRLDLQTRVQKFLAALGGGA